VPRNAITTPAVDSRAGIYCEMDFQEVTRLHRAQPVRKVPEAADSWAGGRPLNNWTGPVPRRNNGVGTLWRRSLISEIDSVFSDSESKKYR